MLDYLRKHTIVIMAAMALVFVGLMFVGGDVSGGSPDRHVQADFRFRGREILRGKGL